MNYTVALARFIESLADCEAEAQKFQKVITNEYEALKT